MDALYVGIDVSKDRLDVHVHPSAQAFAVARSGAGLDDLVARLRPLAPRLIAVEATGGFERVVTAALVAAALPVVVVNPAQVRAFAKALGQRAKTDPVDAAVIAKFVEATKPDLRPLPDETQQHLADLVARRRQIVDMMGAESQREKRATHKRLKKSIARLKKALEKELADIDDDIDDQVRGSPAWRETEDLLVTVPGIGKTIARTLLADLPELGTVTGKKIAALAGLAPFTQQSGRWHGQSHISGGRASVRTHLFMGALAAVRFNPVIQAFWKRLRENGKPKMAVLCAAARKLITILNAMLRDKRPWHLENA
jgi:transposase